MILYRLVTKKGHKAIKRSIITNIDQAVVKETILNQKKFSQKLDVLMSLAKEREKQILDFIKNNRTKIILDFFRKNSAVIVVVLTTLLVAAGNVNSKNDGSGFLFGYFEDSKANNDKIEQRVNSRTFNNNLTMVPLASASDVLGDEEDLKSLMIKDGNLNQNQMQYQVMTATVAPDAKQLISEGADVAVYEVKEGDTVGKIAQDFKITVNTILWANDIDNVDKIMPGDKIFILPVTGVKHVVKNGDSLKSIAKKYEADEQKIIAFNELNADGALTEGMELVIPDGKVEQQQNTTTTTPGSILPRRNYYGSGVADSGSTDTSRTPSVIDKNPKGGHSFPYGYCTWYVATKKYVPWGGNAGTWLYHAKAYGASTGKTPKVGSILVTNESWYGHVAIVEKVSGDNVTISEMNYAGFAKKSTRTISSKSRVIKGYIY